MNFRVVNTWMSRCCVPSKINSAFINNLLKAKKLTIFILGITVFQVNAKSQVNNITISEKNVMLDKVLQKIRTQSGCSLLYNEELIATAKPVSIDVANVSLEEALNESVKDQPFTYVVKNNTVLLTPRKTIVKNVPPIDVRGKIVDEKGLPLPGASVKVKGGGQGTMTDQNGAFAFKGLADDAVLLISFLGYQTKEVKASANLGTIALSPDNSDLNEVVVIGYGTQKKSETTGSLSNLKGSTLADQPVASFESALNGRATGVNMTANAGVVNQAPVFRIRGVNSLSLSSYPLIVVDGVPTFTNENESNLGYAATNPLSAINPADIESVDIAKDAAATSIYGSRAANGVVFITTKKGKQGAAKINFQSSVGFSNANRLPKLLNAAEYIEIKNEGLKNEGTFNPETNYYGLSYDAAGNPIDTRWYDYIYQTGVSNNNNLNISGATQTTKYYGSVGYTKQDGIFRENKFDRKSAMFNVDNKTNSWLSLGAKINYVNENNASAMSTGAAGNSSASGAMSRLALINSPIVSPYNNDGSYNNTSNGYLGIQDNTGHLNQSRLGFYNPEVSLNTNYSRNKVNNIQSNAYIQVNPLPWLAVKSIYGIDYRYTTYENYYSPVSGEGIATNGSSSSANSTRERWVWTNTVTADHVFADHHSFNVLLGQEQQKTNGNQFGLQRQGQSDPLYSNIQGGWQNVFAYNTDNQVYDNYLFSLFSRLQYNFKQKFYVTGNYRMDEFSALGPNNKKGTFWGVSAGWEIMKEDFWSGSVLDKVFSNLKIRASYGKVGNIGGLTDFGALNTYSANLYGGQPGLGYSAAGNPDLKWETSKKTDIGINFGLLGGKLNGELAYYKNNIDGLIFGVPLPPSAGIPNSTNNSILQNVGTMYNQGVEFSLNGAPVRTDNFTWNSSFNITTNKNKVTSLADGVPSIIVGSVDTYSITLPGYAAGMIYAIRTGGIDSQTGRRVFINSEGRKVLYQHVVTPGGPSAYQWSYEDGSRAPAITPAADAVAYKTSAAKMFGGWSNTFQYKQFELSVLLTYQMGGYMMNGTQATMRDQRFWNNSVDVLNRWRNPGEVTNIARVVNGDNVSSGNSMPLDVNVSSTDFLRLKNVMLSYNLPNDFLKRIKVSNAKVFVSGQNLALLTNYTGLDPEVTTNANNAITQGMDKNQSPNARTITVGLNFGF
ncbi:TonB-dependent receptor [Pedobacter antarcticus]|uniref:TonB-dependent receptor n=1 Tax=Pedobacter antarcticus TaxID=34086 RepID=UPI0008841CE0|nr:TonB-dependent receptor [Pedobacter antarcticus]SDL42518.1 TonB-linked outer membrane protein, SusC/RagA family [Pedobacter antarcticus]